MTTNQVSELTIYDLKIKFLNNPEILEYSYFKQPSEIIQDLILLSQTEQWQNVEQVLLYSSWDYNQGISDFQNLTPALVISKEDAETMIADEAIPAEGSDYDSNSDYDPDYENAEEIPVFDVEQTHSDENAMTEYYADENEWNHMTEVDDKEWESVLKHLNPKSEKLSELNILDALTKWSNLFDTNGHYVIADLIDQALMKIASGATHIDSKGVTWTMVEISSLPPALQEQALRGNRDAWKNESGMIQLVNFNSLPDSGKTAPIKPNPVAPTPAATPQPTPTTEQSDWYPGKGVIDWAKKQNERAFGHLPKSNQE